MMHIVLAWAAAALALALAIGWAIADPGRVAASTTGSPISFSELLSSEVPRPASADALFGQLCTSRELDAWLTTTTAGLIHQRSEFNRQGISPSSVVLDASMLSGMPSGRGRGLFFVGNGRLPAQHTVALYRCLLVRSDQMTHWQQDGTVSFRHAAFWRAYTLTLTWDSEPHPWHCLPVGDGPSEAGGASDWWREGQLSAAQLEQAHAALEQERLVDWRAFMTQEATSDAVPRGATGWMERPSGEAAGMRRRLLLAAHLINEPMGDDPETISHMLGKPCKAPLLWCGALLQAKTLVEVEAGQELTWCYGASYVRDNYATGRACDGRTRDTARIRMRAPGASNARL